MSRLSYALTISLALAASVRADPVLPLPGAVAPLLTTVDNPANHLVIAPSAYDGVALLQIGSVGCSGTLITGTNVVLTAAHCVSSAPGEVASSAIATFFLPGGGHAHYSSSSIAVPDEWNGDFRQGYDVAVIRLSGMPSVAGYGLFHGAYDGGQVFLAGYGVSGYGATGLDRNAYPFGYLRWGTNSYDGVWDNPGNPWAFDFDDGTDAHNTFGTLGTGTSEVLIVPGDSGGPTFYNGQIIGVHSFYGRYSDCCDIDLTLNGSFGEVGGDTRVGAYADWLDGQIPEPGTLALAGLGLLVLLGCVHLKRAVG